MLAQLIFNTLPYPNEPYVSVDLDQYTDRWLSLGEAKYVYDGATVSFYLQENITSQLKWEVRNYCGPNMNLRSDMFKKIPELTYDSTSTPMRHEWTFKADKQANSACHMDFVQRDPMTEKVVSRKTVNIIIL